MKKIAVIDDDVNLRKLLTSVFERELEITAISFPPMLEIIDIIKENNFDLLIVDFLMPKIDGVEIIINSLDENHKIPIILTTGYPDMDEVQAVKLNSGKFDISVVGKPFVILDLVDLVRTKLGFEKKEVKE